MESHYTALHTVNWQLGSINASTHHKDGVFSWKTEESCVNCRCERMAAEGDTDFLLVNNILHHQV